MSAAKPSLRALPPGLGAGAGPWRRRRRRSGVLLAEVAEALDLDFDPEPPRAREAAPAAPKPTAIGEVEESTSMTLGSPPSLSHDLDEESTSAALERSSERAARLESTVDEDTEMVARRAHSPPRIRIGDVPLPMPEPRARPLMVLPGDWPLTLVENAPLEGVTAAVAEDVVEGLEALEPEPEGEEMKGDELELEADDDEASEIELDDDEIEGDEHGAARPGAPPSTTMGDLADLLAEADREEAEFADRSVDAPGPLASIREGRRPLVDSVDESSEFDLDAMMVVARQRGHSSDDESEDEVPESVEPSLELEVVADPEPLQDAPSSKADVVPDASEESDEDPAGLSLELDLADEVSQGEEAPTGPSSVPVPPEEDDPAGVSLELELASAPAGPEAWEDELPTRVDDAKKLNAALASLESSTPSPLAMAFDELGAPEEDQASGHDAATESGEFVSLELLPEDSESTADPDVVRDMESSGDDPRMAPGDDLTREAPRAVWFILGSDEPDPAAPLFFELTDPLVADEEIELEPADDGTPVLEDRPPPPPTASPPEDSVDELLILEEEDTGPASLVLDDESEDRADLLAEGGAIRVDLGLGEAAAKTREEARRGVAVAPAQPVHRWEGKSGEGEPATDLVALARLQDGSGAAVRAPEPEASREEGAVEDIALEDDDWLGEMPEEDGAPAFESRPGKGPPMSPFYEDTMPGWMPGDEEGTTRGAPRSADITEGGRGTGSDPKER